MKSMLDQERARSFPRARPRLSAWVVAALFPAALAASCAQGESGETTDTSGSSGDGGAGGGDVGVGGAGGNASSSSSSSASSSSSSSSSSSASSSSSSASSSSSSSSSSGGGAGQGGAGGGWMPPVGTADYPLETEQNNLKATADPLAQGTKGFTASIHPLGDIDTFSVFVTPAGSSLRVTIGDGMGGCPLGADLYVRVFGPGGLIATQFGGCPDLTPANFLALSALPEGTYYAQVESANISEVPFYTVDLSILTPGCGDALVQAAAGEECDDANAVMGDGCFDCKLELNLTPEMESNNTAGMANSLNGFDGAKGSIDPIGDVDYFSFEVTVPGSSANIEISDGLNGCPSGFDSIVYLYNPGGAELASDDDGGVSPCSHISPAAYPAATNLPIGTYTVAVHDLGDNDLQSFYVLEVSVNPPGCGDGLLSGGEQCDDGNMTAGDGCDASCMAEAPWEVEPNNTSMTATPLWAGFSSWRGAIQPVGDVDYFVFNYPGGGAALTLETHDIGSSMSCGYDTVIHLLSSNGQEIVQDDDDGEIPCSKLSPLLDPELVNLPAGTYYVWVQRFMDSDPIPGYELTLTIQ